MFRDGDVDMKAVVSSQVSAGEHSGSSDDRHRSLSRSPAGHAPVPRLPHLRSFMCSQCVFHSVRNPLAALTCVVGTLRELAVSRSCVPACLSALTALESLQVQHCSKRWDAVEALEAALPHLIRLIRLGLGDLPYVPSTVTSLPHLADLSLLWIQDKDQLPAGTWLSRLRSLDVCRRVPVLRPGAMARHAAAGTAAATVPRHGSREGATDSSAVLGSQERQLAASGVRHRHTHPRVGSQGAGGHEAPPPAAEH